MPALLERMSFYYFEFHRGLHPMETWISKCSRTKTTSVPRAWPSFSTKHGSFFLEVYFFPYFIQLCTENSSISLILTACMQAFSYSFHGMFRLYRVHFGPFCLTISKSFSPKRVSFFPDDVVIWTSPWTTGIKKILLEQFISCKYNDLK